MNSGACSYTYSGVGASLWTQRAGTALRDPRSVALAQKWVLRLGNHRSPQRAGAHPDRLKRSAAARTRQRRTATTTTKQPKRPCVTGRATQRSAAPGPRAWAVWRATSALSFERGNALALPSIRGRALRIASCAHRRFEVASRMVSKEQHCAGVNENHRLGNPPIALNYYCSFHPPMR